MNYLRSFLLVLALASFASAEDWPQWMGPRRDGSTSEKITPWKDDLKPLWKEPVGHGFACPVVARGCVYLHALGEGKDQEVLVAREAKTGKELWRDTYNRGSFQKVVGGGPQATPTIAGNRLVTYGVTGVLSCYDLDAGKRLWQVAPYKDFKVNLPRFGVCCSPLVVGNRVIVSVGGKGSAVVGFDLDNGKVVWQAYDDSASTSSPALFSAGDKTSTTLPDVVFMTTLRVMGLNPLDGTLNWEHPLVFQPQGTSPSPIIAGQTIITSTQTNGATAIKVELKDEKPIPTRAWQEKDLKSYFSTGAGVGSDNAVIFTSILQPLPSTTLHYLDLKTGKELWKKNGIGYFHAGVIRTGNDKLLILDDGGNIKLLEANSKEYRELCKAKVCAGTLTTPVFADGCLYARDDKSLVCVPLPH